MQTKLTLSIEKSVIEKAKEFAKRNHTSLSQMIEDYFNSVVKKSSQDSSNNNDDGIAPEIRKFIGILNLPPDFDFEKDRTEYLEKKYTR